MDRRNFLKTASAVAGTVAIGGALGEPVLAQTVIFDPWWGYFGPALVPVNQVLGSVTSNAGALDVGGGINFPVGSGMKIFLETRYVHGFTGNSGTSLVPIMFGVRW